jgi:hypothetical protein
MIDPLLALQFKPAGAASIPERSAVARSRGGVADASRRVFRPRNIGDS